MLIQHPISLLYLHPIQCSCFEIPQKCLTLLCVSGRAVAGRIGHRGQDVGESVEFKELSGLGNSPKASKLCI